MQTSNRKFRLISLLLPATFLGMLAFATAAPKAALRSAGKNNSKPVSSAPVNLGNGIFILGDDSPPARSALSKATAKRSSKSSYSSQSHRAAPTNLNAALVRFCRSYLGYKLGNGQCSELAMLGLPAIGAQMDLNRKWGTPVCNYGVRNGRQYLQLASVGKTRGNPRKANLRPGDIIQYEGVKFERRWDGGYSVKEYPHHTSVVEQVSRDGNTLKVLEQNVNGTQFVVETLLYLPDQTEGIMSITRPLAR